MRCKIQLIFETEEEVITEEIACFHRIDDMSASLGLSLKEAKLIIWGISNIFVKRYGFVKCYTCNPDIS